MALKTFLQNQSRRKFKFITTPLQRRNNSAYTRKIMRYAHNYEANKVKQHDILYQVRDGKSITDSPYAIFKRLVHHHKYRKYKTIII